MENSTVTYILVLLFTVAVWCFKIQKQTLAPGNPNSNYGMYVHIHVYVLNKQEGTQAFDILVFQRTESPSKGAGSKTGCQEKRHTQPRVCVKFLLTF